MNRQLSDEEVARLIAEGERAGRIADETEPRAVRAWYDADRGLVMFELRNGCVFGFPQRYGQGIETADADELAKVEVLLPGDGIGWEDLDAHISVPGLLFDLLNVKAWYAKWLGGSKSEAKAAAARENGKKGGRPRKQSTAAKRPARRTTADTGE